MKQKLITIILTASICFGANAVTTQTKDPYRETKVGTIKVEENFSNRQLTHRMEKAQILVEEIYGTCIDSKRNGRTVDGYYISYRPERGIWKGKDVPIRKGDKVKTVLIYSPYTDWEDDVIARFDFIISRKEN